MSSVNTSSAYQYARPTHAIGDYFEIGYQSLVFIIGTPLNIHSLIIQWRSYQSLKNRHQKKLKTEFLLQKVNLNIANLLTLIIICPLQVAWLISYQWLAGDMVCRLVLYLYMFLLSSNSYIIAVIAIQRLSNVRSMTDLWNDKSSSFNVGNLARVKVIPYFLHKRRVENKFPV